MAIKTKMNKEQRFTDRLTELSQTDSLRELKTVSHDREYVIYKGRKMVNLSSNDYLGVGTTGTLWNDFLKTHPFELGGTFPGSACSSRLQTGNHAAYDELEKSFARMFHYEACMIICTGFNANLGIIPALATANDLIVADKLVHASLIDGFRLSSAKLIRFPHNDLQRLQFILEKERDQYDNVFIVSESIFSMDGDASDMKRLVAIKNQFNAFLYIDEAHSFGVKGEHGLGCIEENGLLGEVDLLVGTFGKSMASQGAYLLCSHTIKDYLVNTMRPMIYTTGLPPWSVKWTQFVLEHLADMKAERQHLAKISDLLRSNLMKFGYETAGESHIVPIILRDLKMTIALSEYLCDNGFFVLPIRHPTVPKGTERLRISLNAAISEQQVLKLIDLCAQFGK
jgi:8-amino-7-oxononanoate synthase